MRQTIMRGLGWLGRCDKKDVTNLPYLEKIVFSVLPRNYWHNEKNASKRKHTQETRVCFRRRHFLRK